MSILKIVKTSLSVAFIGSILTTQVFAQVSWRKMECFDSIQKIDYTVHFEGDAVKLELKGHTYRVPYARSYVSRSGERWSIYKNREIDVRTTIPYDTYVSLNTVPSGDVIAGDFCK